MQFASPKMGAKLASCAASFSLGVSNDRTVKINKLIKSDRNLQINQIQLVNKGGKQKEAKMCLSFNVHRRTDRC